MGSHIVKTTTRRVRHFYSTDTRHHGKLSMLRKEYEDGTVAYSDMMLGTGKGRSVYVEIKAAEGAQPGMFHIFEREFTKKRGKIQAPMVSACFFSDPRYIETRVNRKLADQICKRAVEKHRWRHKMSRLLAELDHDD